MASSFSSWARVRAPSASVVHARSIYDIRSGFHASSKARSSNRFMSSDVKNESPTFQPANRLSGRTCMITGGTSGIGFAIAERFLQEGASSIILVGRSQKRLQDAVIRLGTAASTVPNEGGPIETSERVRLLVGDVAEAGSWMRELEKEMVSYSNLSLPFSRFLDEGGLHILTSKTGKCGCPRQCSRHLYLKHPSPIRTRRYLPDPSHKPRRRNAHLASIDARCDSQPGTEPQWTSSSDQTTIKMYHQHLFLARAEGRNWRCPVRCIQGWSFGSDTVFGC